MMERSRWQIYYDDLTHRGINYFVASRMKKYSLTRRLWYMGKKPFVIVFGHKLFINKMDTVVTEKIMETGTWEPYVTKLFLKEAKKAKLIVDVGANIGYFCLAGEKYAKVVAFEPEKENFELLNKTVMANKLTNIVAEKKAIGNKNGEMTIYKCKDNLGDHRSFDSGDFREKERVEVVTLDKYFSGSKENIDILKIDIQGFEVKAFEGAKKLLAEKRIKVIFSELWPGGLKMAGDSWEKYIKLLETSGFKLWEIDDVNERLLKFDGEKVKKGLEKNPEFTMNILGGIIDE